MKTKLFILPLFVIMFTLNVFALNTVITPSNPTDNEDLLCYVNGATHQDVLSYKWTANGADFTFFANVDTLGSHLPAYATNTGDEIECTASDDFVTGFSDIDSVVILPETTDDNGGNNDDNNNNDDRNGRNKYSIEKLNTYKNGFTIASTSFYRGENIHVKFNVADNLGNPAASLGNEINVVLENSNGQIELEPYNSAGGIFTYRNGERCIGFAGSCMFRSNEGTYYFYGKAPLSDSYLGRNNVAANIEDSNTAEKAVKINNNLPVADAGSDKSTSAGNSIVFDGSLSNDVEDNEELTYLWSFGDGHSANGRTVNHAYNLGGVYVVALTVIDTEGAISKDFVEVEVNSNNQDNELTVNIVEPQNGDSFFILEKVNFNADVSYSGTGELSYSWNFGDGFNSDELSTSHRYLKPGKYNAKLTVSDDVHSASDTVIVIINTILTTNDNTNKGVNAIISVNNNNPTPFETVIFDGSDSTGDITSYEWSFGDGSGANGEVVNHKYNRPGTYTTTITVIDGDGDSDTDSVLIEVKSFNNRGEDHDKPVVEFGDEGDYSSFSISAVKILNIKPAYRKGDTINMIVSISNNGNFGENLHLKANWLGLKAENIQNFYVSHGNSVLRTVNLDVPRDIESGLKVAKIELYDVYGSQYVKYWQFLVA